jgi:hypothetical protein
MIRSIVFFISAITYIILVIHLPGPYSHSLILKSLDDYKQLLPQSNKKLPASIILKNQYTRGIFLKSYLEQLTVIGSTTIQKEYLVEVSSELFNQHKKYIGLSILRCKQFNPDTQEYYYETQSAYPGRLFIGNGHLGYWDKTTKQWQFFYHLRPFFRKALGNTSLSLSKYLSSKQLLHPTLKSTTTTATTHSTKWQYQTVLHKIFYFSLFTPTRSLIKGLPHE